MNPVRLTIALMAAASFHGAASAQTTTPPVTNLTWASADPRTSDETLIFTWTAPSRGTTGVGGEPPVLAAAFEAEPAEPVEPVPTKVDAYRFFLSPLDPAGFVNPGEWSTRPETLLPPPTTPSNPGLTDHCAATSPETAGLTAGTDYWFSVSCLVGTQWSSVATPVRGTTLDDSDAPGAFGAVTAGTPTMTRCPITLSQIPADDGTLSASGRVRCFKARVILGSIVEAMRLPVEPTRMTQAQKETWFQASEVIMTPYVDDVPEPGDPGATQSFSFTGLSGESYYLALVAEDNGKVTSPNGIHGNRSPVSILRVDLARPGIGAGDDDDADPAGCAQATLPRAVSTGLLLMLGMSILGARRI